MKKIVCLLIAVFFAAALTACRTAPFNDETVSIASSVPHLTAITSGAAETDHQETAVPPATDVATPPRRR